MLNYQKISFKISKVIMFSLLFLISCQEGLRPLIENSTDIKAKLTGRIIYKGGVEKFPDSTKCFGIYVVAFKKFPKDSASILYEILSGNAYLKYESLPYPADSSDFSLEIADPPVTIEYLVVAMQSDSLNIEAQRAIGVYTETGDNTKPSIITILPRDSIFVTINVDFDNLPPQPFK